MNNAKPNYCQKGVECLDAIKAATEGLTGYEGFLIGSVIKHCWRWNKKDDVADLRKAAEYLHKLTEGATVTPTENRPYTLDELRALPDGAQVWVEDCPGFVCEVYESGWYTKEGDLLGAYGTGYYDLDNPDPLYKALAWPTPPSVEDEAKWLWEGKKCFCS